MEKRIQIGWAERDITPPGPVVLHGEFYEKLLESIETPLMATAMAVEGDGGGTVLVSCDLIGVSAELMAETRRRLSGRAPGLSPDSILLFATHIHTGPHFLGLSGEDFHLHNAMLFVPEGKPYQPLCTPGSDSLDEVQCLNFLAEQIADAVEAAWNSRADAFLSPEFGRTSIAYCRRMQLDDGTAKTTGKMNIPHLMRIEGCSDNGVELNYTFDSAKRLTGVMVNLACPAQSAEGIDSVSSDFWGKVRKAVKAHFKSDVHVLAICGAAGDQGVCDQTRRHSRDMTMDKILRTEMIGKQIFQVVAERYDAAREAMTQDVPVRHLRFDYDAPIRRVSEADYTAARQELDAYVAAHDKPYYNYRDMSAMYPAAGILKRHECQDTQPTRHLELHAIRLGDLAIVSNPFELYLEYGMQIRVRATPAYAQQVMIAQLACGYLDYLPSEISEPYGGYGSNVSSGCIGSDGGKLLVSRSLDAIKNLFSEA